MDQLICLRHHRIVITDVLVRVQFNDGTHSELDITQSHGPNYCATALFWGYEDHVLYAWHHDLTHCWVNDKIFDQPSPTLWAQAHGLPVPPGNRQEEHLVNTIQYAIATKQEKVYASYFFHEIGINWYSRLLGLKRDYQMWGLPFPK